MRKVITTILVLAVLFVGWVLWVCAWLRSVAPAGPTLAEHLAHRPAPRWQRVFVADGQEYLALYGPMQMLPRLPSGPPVYIFDRAGLLVDWTIDEGDDNAFLQRWPRRFGGQDISPDELAEWPGAR
jgi:hypothetical protein